MGTSVTPLHLPQPHRPLPCLLKLFLEFFYALFQAAWSGAHVVVRGDELDEKLFKMEQKYRELDTPAYDLEPDTEGAMGAYVGADPKHMDHGGRRSVPLPGLDKRKKARTR